MATESADESDLSVSLPPPLEEWIDERAASLGVDREELLVQMMSAYRAAADLEDDDGATPAPDQAAVREQVEAEVRAQLADLDDGSAADERLDELEENLEQDLESLRNRVLQLRDAVRNRAKTDHTHEEFQRLGDRLDEVATEVAALSEADSKLETGVADVTSKLDTLARVVLELRNDDGEAAPERRRHLEQLRATANRRGVTDADCGACGASVSIPLLSEPACPHCGAELRDITTTGLIFTHATLVGPEPEPEPDLESGEADDA